MDLADDALLLSRGRVREVLTILLRALLRTVYCLLVIGATDNPIRLKPCAGAGLTPGYELFVPSISLCASATESATDIPGWG